MSVASTGVNRSASMHDLVLQDVAGALAGEVEVGVVGEVDDASALSVVAS